MFADIAYQRIKKFENFYYEFHNYAKAKRALIGKTRETMPERALKGFDARVKIIEDFEKKYLTKEIENAII